MKGLIVQREIQGMLSMILHGWRGHLVAQLGDVPAELLLR